MRRRISSADGHDLRERFTAIRREAEVREAFPPEVLDEARAASLEPARPGISLEAVPFVTLDPPASMDLDQAFHLERLAGGGFRVRYAIADVAAFVAPGGALDAEAWRRVQTIYCPDERITLYPTLLSEGAASLLPGADRPAVTWTVDVASDGTTRAIDVERAMIRSRSKLGYPAADAAIAAGTAEPPLSLLREVGGLLEAAEHARGGMTLRLPSQEVERDADGRYRLTFRQTLPVEDWNAQLSLLVGRAAAAVMLAGGTGILRTMPPADPRDVARLRRVAAGLALDWGAEQAYGAFVSGLDGSTPAQVAFLNEAGALFRGAGYTPFDGTLPDLRDHAAIAAPYAHCTAPLRRLVDRYVSEVCLALCAGVPVPRWAREALAGLPAAMSDGGRRAGRVERSTVDLVEAAVLGPWVGETFGAFVVSVDDDGEGGEVALADLSVVARSSGRLPLGERVEVRLVEADPGRREVRFAYPPEAAAPRTESAAQGRP